MRQCAGLHFRRRFALDESDAPGPAGRLDFGADAERLGMIDEWRRFDVSDLIDRKALEIGDGYRAKNAEMASAGLPPLSTEAERRP